LQRFRTVVVLAAATVCVASAEPAMAAPTPVSATRFVMTVDRKLELRLQDNCTSFTAIGWVELDRVKNLALFGSAGAATGAYDLEARAGTVESRGDALQLEPLGWRYDEYRRPAKLTDIGLEVANGRAYLTGNVKPGKPRSVAARRQRLALIAKPTFFSGPAHYTDKSPVPNSYLFAFQGNATVLPALAAAMEQTRCKKSRFRGPHAGPIRAGTKLGQITAQMGVAAATGLDGAVELSDEPWLSVEENDAPVTATPVAGAKRVVKGKVRSIRFALTPGTRVLLICSDGYKCEPTGGSYGLVGGFTLSVNGHTATVGDLSVTYAARSSGGPPSATINGTLDGQPVAFAVGSGGGYASTSDDFVQRLGGAWGTKLRGREVIIAPEFTSTGPA
jgi:hypothetical protein